MNAFASVDVRRRRQRLHERQHVRESACSRRSAPSAPSSAGRTDSRRARCSPTRRGACPSAGTRDAARGCPATRARPRARRSSGRTKYASHVPSGVLMLTSLSLTSTAFAARGSIIATPTAAAMAPTSLREYGISSDLQRNGLGRTWCDSLRLLLERRWFGRLPPNIPCPHGPVTLD